LTSNAARLADRGAAGALQETALIREPWCPLIDTYIHGALANPQATISSLVSGVGWH